MKIYLIRHGQSVQNVTEDFLTVPDQLIPLTEKGKIQAFCVGKFLQETIPNSQLAKSLIISSTYLRAKQTAAEINKSLKLKVLYDKRIREFKRGLFGKYSYKECEVRFPKEFNKFKEALESNKFYAKGPEGESAYDVSLRLKPFKEYLNELEKSGVENLVIVSHSCAIRTFLTTILGRDEVWYAKEKNMINCSVRYLEKYGEKYIDNGYIYGGYKQKPKTDDNQITK